MVSGESLFVIRYYVITLYDSALRYGTFKGSHYFIELTMNCGVNNDWGSFFLWFIVTRGATPLHRK